MKDIKVRLFVEEAVWIVIPFMHKVVYDDYCIYWNRDALYHNFLRRTRPLSWSLELAQARLYIVVDEDLKRVSQSSSEKSGNYMAQTILQLLLILKRERRADDALRCPYIFVCGNVHLMNIVVGLCCKMDRHGNNIVIREDCFVFDKLNFLLFSSIMQGTT